MTGRTNFSAALILIGLLAQTDTQPGPAAILGWWHGTSLCTKASWNAACHDEVVVYEFVPAPPDSEHALVHAFKVVNGQLDDMGDLPMVYAPDSAAWHGDFANARVNIRWTFQAIGDTLVGHLVQRPSMQVARQVRARRGKE